MLYAKLTQANEVDVFPYSLEQLKADHPNTSFPNRPTANDLQGFNVVEVEASEAPVVSYEYNLDHTAVFAQGKWKEEWRSIPASDVEIQARTTMQAVIVRDERNRRLSLSDWTQLADSHANKTSWGAYRQALRDVPSQFAFPWSVQWPDEPTD